MRLAVSRYHEAMRIGTGAAEALAAGFATSLILEGLRRETYFLGHLYETFRDDAVLRKVFPAPKVVEADADPARRLARRGRPPPSRRRSRSRCRGFGPDGR